MDKKKKSKIILAILIAVLVVSVSFIVVYFVKQNNAKNEYKDLQSKAKVKETTQETPDESQEDGEYKSPIDFEELWKTNEEIYAWIQIPGTDIDYRCILLESYDRRNRRITGVYLYRSDK